MILSFREIRLGEADISESVGRFGMDALLADLLGQRQSLLDLLLCAFEVSLLEQDMRDIDGASGFDAPVAQFLRDGYCPVIDLSGAAQISS